MAAYAALASLMNNIEQMMNHPHLFNSFNKKQIQSLLEKSGVLLDIIEVNRGSKETDDLERQITCAAHVAEDIIECHIVDLIHAGSSSSFLLNANKKVTKVKNRVQEWVRRIALFAPAAHATEDVIEESLGSMVNLQRIIEEMKTLMGKADEVLKIDREEHEQPTHSTLPLMESGKTGMIGLEDELKQLLGELTVRRSNRHTISIVGMGGMGKTTLAKNIYAHPLIIEHFDIRAWATVSQQYDAQEILSQLLSSLGKLSDGSVGELGLQLHKALIGRRYLVILDDIWSVEAWDKVRRYFPEDGCSSRVVLTTRLSNVASACGSSCFTMNLLDEGKSWKLFCEKAIFPHKDDPLELEDVGKEIVRSCKGLALSIVVIGGLLLKSPRTLAYWEDVAENLKSIPNSKEKQQGLHVLSLSYNNLPPHLKPCFLYMGIFAEDSDIRVTTITRLWVAEGFIRPNGTRVLEEIAQGCLKDLIDRNLILVRRHRRNGEIGSCGIHDLLKDLCENIADQQDFFHVRDRGNIRGTDRRLICDIHNSDIRSPLARSILTMNLNVTSIKCKLLRVLGDSQNRVHDPPQEVLYENVNLRYLAYKNSLDYDIPDTWKLPTSVSLIWNLQTLMIIPSPYSNTLVVASSKMWKMRQLRHIKFPKLYLPRPSDGEDNLFILENFQTLTTAVNLRLSEEVCKIIPNINKLGLLYDPHFQGYDGNLIECLCNLNLFENLKSLKMKIQVQAPDYELLKKLTFPCSLTKLSLEECRLEWNDLGMIGSLPKLQVLCLQGISVTEGKQWSPSNGQFLNLKFLKIARCELSKWDADDCHFPALEQLHLFRLANLEEIPLDIGDPSTLELIRVERCNLLAAISAMKINEYHKDMGNDSLQIQIITLGSQEERFMEMVETEQLTLSYIQFETRY